MDEIGALPHYSPRKTLEVANIAFPASGLFPCVVIASVMLSDKSKSAELDADTRLLTDAYARTSTLFGLGSRHVETIVNRPIMHHQLLQVQAGARLDMLVDVENTAGFVMAALRENKNDE